MIQGRSLFLVGALVLMALSVPGAARVGADHGARIWIDPAEQEAGAPTFTVNVMQHADVSTAGAEVGISFNRTLLQLVSVQRGPAYAGAAMYMGIAPQTGQGAIDDANSVTGTLSNVATYFFPGTGSVAAGDAVFLTITMAPVSGANGASDLVLSRAEMYDADLNELTDVVLGGGRVGIGDADGDGIDWSVDNCRFVNNPGQGNADGNVIDLTPPEAQDDTSWVNSDGEGDACDFDADNDGLGNEIEPFVGPGGAHHAACPGASANTSQIALDSDGDLFTDGAECALGTDPMSAASEPTDASCATFLGVTASTDTDADAVRDVVEYCHYGSDRTKADTDSDGRADGCEVASVDTDNSVNEADRTLIMAHTGAVLGSGAYRLDFDLDRNGAITAGDALFVVGREATCS